MKIYVLKAHPAWAYQVGMTGEVPDDRAKPLIEAGYWKQIDEAPVETKSDKPTSGKPASTRRRKSISAD